MMPRPPRAAVESQIELPQFDLRTFELTLIGDSPLICHAWSKKAKGEMLAKQMKQPQEAKTAKDPGQDFEESLYRHPKGGYGFPVIAFKGAAVDACSHVKGITKVEARGAFHINGDLLQLESDEPSMREDMVRIFGTADIRYRGQFDRWAVRVPIRHNAGVLSAGQIIHLFNIAGFSIGVGDWRPQRDGSYGMFHVAQEGETFERAESRVSVEAGVAHPNSARRGRPRNQPNSNSLRRPV